MHRTIGAFHNGLQAVIDLILGPEETLQVLHPLEVAHRHATGIRQDIRHNRNAAIIEDTIRIWSSRSISRLNNQASPHPWCIPPRQLILQRRGYQRIAGKLQQFSIGDWFCFRQTFQCAMLFWVS